MIKNKHAFVAMLSLFILIGIFVGVNVSGNSHSNKQLSSALCEKYGWESEDIKVLKHKKAHYEHDFGFFGLDAMNPPIWRINEKWVCEYKGREFNVEYTDRQFADDYQLEDIFKWCTEWLQKNVDPEIVGVEIFSDVIYHSSENRLPSCNLGDTKTVFTKNDAEEILKAQKEVFSYYAIFYKVDDINDYGTIKHSELHGFGNQNYISFRIRKESKLNKKTVTQGSNVVIIQNIQFSRTPNTIEYTSYQNYYSLDRSIKYIWS